MMQTGWSKVCADRALSQTRFLSCDDGKVHVCLPAVAQGEAQPVAEALRDPDSLDPFELAELESEISAVEMGIRETLAGASGRRRKVMQALLQSAVDMRALLVTRR